LTFHFLFYARKIKKQSLAIPANDQNGRLLLTIINFPFVFYYLLQFWLSKTGEKW